jgi:hypothetical protein
MSEELVEAPQEVQYPYPNFPMLITEEEDGSFTIQWDENHPVTSMFNTWTEEDFTNMIIERCKEILGEEEFEE